MTIEPTEVAILCQWVSDLGEVYFVLVITGEEYRSGKYAWNTRHNLGNGDFIVKQSSINVYR